MYKYNKTTAPTKKEPVENIKEFENSKSLYQFSKRRSPLSIVFLENEEDPWFIFVKYYKTKSGEITNSCMIIQSDLETWLNSTKRAGYEEVKKITKT